MAEKERCGRPTRSGPCARRLDHPGACRSRSSLGYVPVWDRSPRECVVCGERFTPESRGKPRDTCSDKCQRVTPEGYAAVQRAKDRMTAKRRALVSEIKLERGCIDCGYNKHPAALDFDHKPGVEKVGDISQLILGGFDVLMAEIEKCEVRCANCHRIKTTERRLAVDGEVTA